MVGPVSCSYLLATNPKYSIWKTSFLPFIPPSSVVVIDEELGLTHGVSESVRISRGRCVPSSATCIAERSLFFWGGPLLSRSYTKLMYEGAAPWVCTVGHAAVSLRATHVENGFIKTTRQQQ